MATNADENGADDTDLTAEDELRSAKYPDEGVETPKGEDEPTDGEGGDDDPEDVDDDDDKIADDDASKDDSEEDDKTDSDDDDSYVKEFPNIKGDTLEEYSRGLEEAYKNSTAEALRLKRELDELKASKPAPADNADDDDGDKAPAPSSDPLTMWAKQSLEREIDEAYADFRKIYPQVDDEAEYAKFTKEVATLSTTIQNSQNRMATPRELYTKAAVILGWEADKPTSQDRLKVAIKNGAAISKSSGAIKKPVRSKVDDNQVAIYRKMNPSDNKSDSEIRKELEAFV